MSQQRSALARGWSGFWRFVDGTRRVLVNLVFLVLLVLIIVWLSSAGDQVVLEPGTALVLRPTGMVVEEFSGDPLDRAIQQATMAEPEETRLRDMLQAIHMAASDDAISMLVIEPDRIWGIGLASLKELEAAVSRFRESGKPVIAAASGLGQHPYYLAALADEVWLHPHGWVWMDGYAAYRNYYAEGLDKLAVEINLFRAGEYKSAMEPFVRNDMSPESREANLFWLGNLWQQYLEGVSRARGVPLETLAEAIDRLPERVDEAGGNLAQLALELGLVDRLAGHPEMRQELSQRGVSIDSDGRLNEIGFREYLAARPLRSRPAPGASVAVVVAEGEILQGVQPPGTVGAESIAERLYQAGVTDGVQAVVLRVDSPGGDAFASEIVRRELQSLRDAGKTVVVSMGDVAASGGYWIGLPADEIWASAATITGSIGVVGMVPTFGESLQKLGIHTDGVGTTPLAGRLRLDLPMDEGLRRIFQSTTEETYQRFLALVAEARGLTTDEVHEVARGRVWTGQQAADRGLVDRVGTLAEAMDSAARIAGLGEDYETRWIEPELTGFERFMLSLTGDSRVRINATLPGHDTMHLPLVQRLLHDVRALLRPGQAFSVAAHCLCGVE